MNTYKKTVLVLTLLCLSTQIFCSLANSKECPKKTGPKSLENEPRLLTKFESAIPLLPALLQGTADSIQSLLSSIKEISKSKMHAAVDYAVSIDARVVAICKPFEKDLDEAEKQIDIEIAKVEKTLTLFPSQTNPEVNERLKKVLEAYNGFKIRYSQFKISITQVINSFTQVKTTTAEVVNQAIKKLEDLLLMQPAADRNQTAAAAVQTDEQAAKRKLKNQKKREKLKTAKQKGKEVEAEAQSALLPAALAPVVWENNTGLLDQKSKLEEEKINKINEQARLNKKINKAKKSKEEPPYQKVETPPIQTATAAAPEVLQETPSANERNVVMSGDDMRKLFEQEGYKIQPGRGKGSHMVLIKKDNPTVIIPHRKELAVGTQLRLLKILNTVRLKGD